MRKFRWQKKLTDKQYNYLIEETDKRLRNIFFAKSDFYSSYVLDELGGKNIFKNIKPNDNIEYNIKINMVGNDLIEIIGGIKSKHEVK